jgi:hypothetical protein
MRRLAAIVLMIGALGAPLPLFAAGMGCGPVHACCAGDRIKTSEVDCCETSMCSDPEPATPAVVTASQVLAPAGDSGTVESVDVQQTAAVHASISPSPPSETRLRLASLSTLLI